MHDYSGFFLNNKKKNTNLIGMWIKIFFILGEFSFRIGIPAKSSKSGLMMLVLPG